MKSIFSGLIFTLLLSVNAKGQGINFFHGKWSEALEKAKSEDKLIFVDAYASWCGPCKRMSSEVFTHPKSGEFYNSSFVCLKIDMEKPENSDFADKYPVMSYPTLMFIDPAGKIVLKDIGYRDVEPFVELGKKALNKVTNATEYAQQYADGNRDPQFLFRYVSALNRTGSPSLKITNDYLNTQSDLSTDFNQRFIFEGATEADSRVFDLLIKNRARIEALVGKEPVDAKIETACKNTVKKAISFKDEKLLGEAIQKMKSANPDRGGQFELESKRTYFAAVKDVKNYLKAVKAYQKALVKNSAAKQHELVIDMLESFPNDPSVLRTAAQYEEKAAENGGLPEYYLTLAGIYKQQGDKEKAKNTAQQAIKAIGEKDNGMRARIEYFLNSLG